MARKVQITTITREKIDTTVETWDPQAINDMLNNEDAGAVTGGSRTVVIGEVIINRSDVARVVPVSE